MGISFMLYKEVVIIRRHDLATEEIADKSLISREKVSDVTNQAWEFMRLNAHKAIISTLKGWVIFTHKTNKYIKDKLASRPKGNENGTVSTFLTTVSDYKSKMKKMRTRLKQRDEE